jgi:TonB family protein
MGHQSNNDSTFGVAGVEGGLPNPGVPCSISSSDSAPNAQATPPNKINISAGVAVGLLCERFQPIYPLIAKAAHVSGTVVLQATISKTGYVENLRVVSGPAMLQQAALDAVKNWRYRPYLLNNEPVEVETTVNVIFTLGDSGAVGSASGNDSTPGVASGTDSCHPNPDAKEPPPKRVTISSGVAAGLLIRKTPPISPPFSLVAHQIETVVLKIIISKTGEVESRRVVSGPATRRQAALDAVKDWHYKPYLINCKPVEVETTVTIAFLPDK